MNDRFVQDVSEVVVNCIYMFGKMEDECIRLNQIHVSVCHYNSDPDINMVESSNLATRPFQYRRVLQKKLDKKICIDT